jgi:hypothetical protein
MPLYYSRTTFRRGRRAWQGNRDSVRPWAGVFCRATSDVHATEDDYCERSLSGLYSGDPGTRRGCPRGCGVFSLVEDRHGVYVGLLSVSLDVR